MDEEAIGQPDGSSPLARGLPQVVGVNIELDGIIPARAGFTPHSPAPPGSPPDHPRSRGVYTMRKTIEDAKKGSSPLARGLLSSRHRRGLRNWIIPARAGFTTHP